MKGFLYKLGAIFFGLSGFLAGFYFLVSFAGSEGTSDAVVFLTSRICLFLITVASFATSKYFVEKVK